MCIEVNVFKKQKQPNDKGENSEVWCYKSKMFCYFVSREAIIGMMHTNITPAEKTKITFLSFLSAFTAMSIFSEKIAKQIAGIKNHQYISM